MQWKKRWNTGNAWYTELHEHSVQGLYSVRVEQKHQLKISCSPAASCHDPPLSEETLLTQYTWAERQRMKWSDIYNYLPL